MSLINMIYGGIVFLSVVFISNTNCTVGNILLACYCMAVRKFISNNVCCLILQHPRLRRRVFIFIVY